MDGLSVVWWSSTAGAMVAATVGVVAASRRGPALGAAAVLFLVSGVLAILSIGIVFIIAALACVSIAARDPGLGADPTSTRR